MAGTSASGRVMSTSPRWHGGEIGLCARSCDVLGVTCFPGAGESMEFADPLNFADPAHCKTVTTVDVKIVSRYDLEQLLGL